MARKVFFSFHYDRDSHRISQIRNCNVVSAHFTTPPFYDKAGFEQAKRQKGGIRNWIDENMYGTSVLVICYGYETAGREWVQYEIKKAYQDNMGILSIDMSGMQNLNRQIDYPGTNPLSVINDRLGVPLINNNAYRSYHWVRGDGSHNIDQWIETAARLVGR